MNYVSYHRPWSKVGFRLIGATTPAHAAALSGIGSLGDDTSTLANYGFTSAEIAQITSAHQSGALSDAGYQQLVSGTVDPSQLGDFLAADLGAPTASPSWFTQSTMISGIPNWTFVALG